MPPRRHRREVVRVRGRRRLEEVGEEELRLVAWIAAAAASAAAAGCSVDRIEWESSGFPVEEVEHVLREEHHVEPEGLECIKREVGGSLWECRAHAEGAEYACEVHVGIREQIRKLHCERKEAEEHAATTEQPHGQTTSEEEHAG